MGQGETIELVAEKGAKYRNRDRVCPAMASPQRCYQRNLDHPMPHEERGRERLGTGRTMPNGMDEKPNDNIVRIPIDLMLSKKSHPMIQLIGGHESQQNSTNHL